MASLVQQLQHAVLMPQGQERRHRIWIAVLDVDTGDVLGVPTTHVIGKLEYADPAPMEWVEPEGPMESFGFEDWPGVGVVYAD